MSQFFEVFHQLCREQKTTPNAIAKELGISSGTITNWKNGAVPRISAVQKIADHFNVSVDHLLGIEEASSVIHCDECGMQYNADDTEETAKHDERHATWNRAVERFGFCWPFNRREEMKSIAREKIAAGHLSDEEYAEQQIMIFKSLFSRSLEASGFDLNHVDFPTYVSMILNQEQWQNSIPLHIYEKMAQTYGVRPGIYAGTYYTVPAKNIKKSPTSNGERLTENPDIRMIARAGKKMTPEQAENLRKYAQYMFPEAFKDDDT